MYVHTFKAVLFDVSVEYLHVLYDFGQIVEALLFWVSVLVLPHEAYSSIVVDSKDETLAFVWGVEGYAGFLRFASHCECCCVGRWFGSVVFWL